MMPSFEEQLVSVLERIANSLEAIENDLGHMVAHLNTMNEKLDTLVGEQAEIKESMKSVGDILEDIEYRLTPVAKLALGLQNGDEK